MNHDPSNPFHKLAKVFAERKDAGRAPQRPRAQPHSPSTIRGEKPPGEDDDEALFLDAVRRIKPLADKKTETHSPGERLAERMRSGPDETGRARRTTTFGTRPPDNDRSAVSGARLGLHHPPAAQQDAPAPTARASSPTDPAVAAEPSFPSAMRDGYSDRTQEPAPEEDALFAKAMQGVAPVNGKGRDIPVPGGTVAGAGRPVLAPDPAKALRDVLEGRVEFALHHTDEFMEGYVVGVDPLVLSRLRAGQYSPEKHLDMHGMNARQAYDALTWFIRESYQRGLRCVVVVTGRGRNSPDGIGVLRLMLQRWLSRDPFKRVVLAFCTARPGDGGPGAAYVLLRKYKKSRGKIIWDHTPSDENFPDM